ncbi:MAG: hypothetical protein ACYTG2_03840 [Planctomycetota bacterium]|jgi:hypothetical protein
MRIGAVLVLVAIGVGIWFATRGPDTVAYVQAGREAMDRGDFTGAIAEFEKVPADDVLYGQAQEKLVEARELMVADEAREGARMADNLHGVLERLRKDYVDGPGNAVPEYAPNCRYLLKRAREFLERYPDDPRAPDVKALFPYYAKVASLDKPPTEADVRAEMGFRFQSGQFLLAMQAVDEAAAESEEVAAVADTLRGKVLEQAEHGWKQTLSIIEDALVPGEENWNRVQGRVRRYLDNIEGLEGVGDEARALYEKALAAMQAGG